jgi:hypothetical protein
MINSSGECMTYGEDFFGKYLPGGKGVNVV